MKTIWSNIEDRNWKAATKLKAFLWVLGILFGFIGLVVWGVVQIWALKTIDWMFCFIGYPVIASWLVVLFYCGNHDFHDGKPLAK